MQLGLGSEIYDVGRGAGYLKFISQEDIRLDMSVRLMICLFVLERRLFDMCSWGRIERNVSFFFDFGAFFLGENRAGYEW